MQRLNQKFYCGLFLLALVSFITFQAQGQTKQVSYGIEKSKDWRCKVYKGPGNVHHYILNNGLNVIFSTNKSKPIVETRIAVKAGSKNDPSSNTGLAHYLEHMLFKGTDKFGTHNFAEEKKYLKQIEELYEVYNKTTDVTERKKIYAQIDSISGLASKYSIANEYDKMVQGIGATGTNAYTSVEQTVYVNTVPNNEIHRWIEIESERFRNPIMRLFHTELEAVYEEKNISMDNDMSQVFETMNASLFQNHNYGLQTTIGTVEHLKNPSIVAIKDYYSKYYVPNNMAIIMSGDFGYDSTIAMIVEHFSYMQQKPVPEYKFKIEYPSASPKEKTVVGKNQPSVWLGYRLPGFSTKEAMMAELVDMLLNNSTAGLFDLNLVKAQKVLGAGSFMNDMKDYSVHFMYGYPKKSQSLKDVKNLLLSELNKIKQGQFSDTLLQSIILDYQISKMKSYESARGMIGDLTSAFIYDLDWMEYSNRLYYQSRFTKEDIIQFVNEYYKEDYTIIYKEQGKPTQKPSIEKPLITPVELNRDKTSEFVKNIMSEGSNPIQPVFVELDKAITYGKVNNAPLWHVSNTSNELFTLYYVLDMGKYHNKVLPLAIDYISYLGAGSKSAADVAKEFYQLGSSFSVSSGNEECYVYLSGIQKNFMASVKLFEELLRNPNKNEEAFQNLINDIKTQRANNKSNKRAISTALRSYALYGKNNPYNYQLSEQELNELKAEDLITIIKSLLNYEHTVMYYGPSSIAQIQQEMNPLHPTPANWTPTPNPIEFVPIQSEKTQIFLAQYDDMVQAQINWVKRSKQFNSDQLAISALHRDYFGGGMSGVVFQTIRESKSLAYSSYSVYSPSRQLERYNTVYSFIGTQSDKMKDAIVAMNELHQNLPQVQASFDRAKDAVVSKMRTERTQKTSLFWLKRELLKMGLDSNYKAELLNSVQNLEIKDLVQFHSKEYGELPFNYAILGDKSKLDMAYLKTLGEIKEVSLEELFGY